MLRQLLTQVVLISIVFFGFVRPIFAQSPDTLWTKTFGGNNGDGGYSVQQVSDGGFILTGATNSFGMGLSDVLLIRTDSLGNTLWIKTFGGNDDEVGHCVLQTLDGGYIIAGYTGSFGNGSSDVWLIKTNSSGNTQWTKTIGGSELDRSYSIQQTSDSGFIISGYTLSIGGGNMLLIRTDAMGNVLWNQNFGGGIGDHGYSVQNTPNGGYIVAGWTGSFGSGGSDVFIVSTDASGDSLWSQTIGGSSDERGYSIQRVDAGGYVVTGYTESVGNGRSDVLLQCINNSGNTLWTKTFGGIEDDKGYCVQQTFDGGFIITGWTASYGAGGTDIFLIRTDMAGNLLWTKTLGGINNELGYSVQQTSDGGYIVTGLVDVSGSGNFDVWLVKLAPETPTAIENQEEPNNLQSFHLFQNYPNPFNPVTKISWHSPVDGWQTLKIYDVLGNEVASLVNEYKSAGIYEIIFDATKLSSGAYFYQLKVGSFTQTRKLILLR